MSNYMLEQNYRLACQKTVDAFQKAKEVKYAPDLMLAVGEAQRAESYALQRMENPDINVSQLDDFKAVQKKLTPTGSVGAKIREEVGGSLFDL